MATKTIEERLKEFFSDPSKSEESEFFKAGVKHVVAEMMTEEEARKKKEEEEKGSGLSIFPKFK